MNITKDFNKYGSIEPKSKYYYAGFLSGLRALTVDKIQTEITLSPTNFATVERMLFDYGLLEDRREIDAINTTGLRRRIADLEADADQLHKLLSLSSPIATAA